MKKLPRLLIYLSDVEYKDGTGKGLAQEILNEAQKRNKPSTKMIGFGSDGANIKNREGKGVNWRLKEKMHTCFHLRIFFNVAKYNLGKVRLKPMQSVVY